MSGSQVIQDATNCWAMSAVVRVEVHGLRRCREASPYVAWRALCVGHINQRVKGKAELAVIEEVLVESEFFAARVRQLAASSCELLPRSNPRLTQLRHDAIIHELAPFDTRTRLVHVTSVTIQSAETVDLEYQGSWFYALR